MEDGGHFKDLAVRHRFLTGADHLPECVGHAEHFVVVAKDETSFDGGCEFEASLREMYRGRTVIVGDVRPTVPYFGRHPVRPGDKSVCRLPARIQADWLDTRAAQSHDRPYGMMSVNDPAVRGITAPQAGDHVLQIAMFF